MPPKTNGQAASAAKHRVSVQYNTLHNKDAGHASGNDSSSNQDASFPFRCCSPLLEADEVAVPRDEDAEILSLGITNQATNLCKSEKGMRKDKQFAQRAAPPVAHPATSTAVMLGDRTSGQALNKFVRRLPKLRDFRVDIVGNSIRFGTPTDDLSGSKDDFRTRTTEAAAKGLKTPFAYGAPDWNASYEHRFMIVQSLQAILERIPDEPTDLSETTMRLVLHCAVTTIPLLPPTIYRAVTSVPQGFEPSATLWAEKAWTGLPSLQIEMPTKPQQRDAEQLDRVYGKACELSFATGSFFEGIMESCRLADAVNESRRAASGEKCYCSKEESKSADHYPLDEDQQPAPPASAHTQPNLVSQICCQQYHDKSELARHTEDPTQPLASGEPRLGKRDASDRRQVRFATPPPPKNKRPGVAMLKAKAKSLVSKMTLPCRWLASMGWNGDDNAGDCDGTSQQDQPKKSETSEVVSPSAQVTEDYQKGMQDLQATRRQFRRELRADLRENSDMARTVQQLITTTKQILNANHLPPNTAQQVSETAQQAAQQMADTAQKAAQQMDDISEQAAQEILNIARQTARQIADTAKQTP